MATFWHRPRSPRSVRGGHRRSPRDATIHEPRSVRHARAFGKCKRSSCVCVWCVCVVVVVVGAYAVRVSGYHLRHRDDLLSPPPLSCGRRASSKSRVCRRRCGRSGGSGGAGGARLWQFLGAANQLPKKQRRAPELSASVHSARPHFNLDTVSQTSRLRDCSSCASAPRECVRHLTCWLSSLSSPPAGSDPAA
eukprot:SAG22_NODE_497_length_9790_cov_3.684178_6_plen_193_part_00